MSTVPSNPDVIVVGAGTAGLSAAKALMEKGFQVAVVEANGHVGGRCITDETSFSTPFDRGGSWLHSAPINPLARVAEARGEALHKASWRPHWVRVPGQSPGRAPQPGDVAAYGHYYEEMWTAIHEAGAGAQDRSVASALPASPWRDTARHWVAQMQGGDADVTSCQDVHRYADAEGDWLVAGGLGAFVRRLHSDVGVQLNTPVTKIDYTGDRVRATTPRGEIAARHLVLTVSTGVLAAERIAFAPGLPDAKLSAIEQLPMGLLNKVGIEFAPEWREAHQGQIADFAAEGEAFCTLLFGFYGGPLGVGFLAGRFADEAEREGPGAATAFCLGALREIFGSEIDKHIRRTEETGWRADAHALGSYSYARPGGADGRAVLAEPIDDRIFFAGEAVMPNAYATVHGAYMSGLLAAEKICAVRGG